MSYLKGVAEALRLSRPTPQRDLLKTCHAELIHTFVLFTADPTIANMQRMNAAWSRTANALLNLPPEGAPAPLGGSPEAARLAG